MNQAAPDLPVFLFSTRPVNPGTAALCAKVFTGRSPARVSLRDVPIRETSSAFAAAVIDLLRNEVLRARIAAQGRQTAEQRFGWPAISDRAYASYMSISRGETERVGERPA